jgi:hypothetical protein
MSRGLVTCESYVTLLLLPYLLYYRKCKRLSYNRRNDKDVGLTGPYLLRSLNDRYLQDQRRISSQMLLSDAPGYC